MWHRLRQDNIFLCISTMNNCIAKKHYICRGSGNQGDCWQEWHEQWTNFRTRPQTLTFENSTHLRKIIPHIPSFVNAILNIDPWIHCTREHKHLKQEQEQLTNVYATQTHHCDHRSELPTTCPLWWPPTAFLSVSPKRRENFKAFVLCFEKMLFHPRQKSLLQA